MDRQIQCSNLGLRSALGLVTAVSVALAALFLFAGALGTYRRYYPLLAPSGGHLIDGATYGPLGAAQIVLAVIFTLLYAAVIVSAIGLWSRFRRFAPMLAVATVVLAVSVGQDTVICAWQQESSCELLFHLDWRWAAAAGWACLVVLVLRQVGRTGRDVDPAAVALK